MRVRVVRADPSGNITLFVLDPVERAERPALAARLMALPGLAAEQVGFVCPAEDGLDGRIEMSGGEFCGNAGRSYGMFLARRRGLTGVAHLTLGISGSDAPVAVDADTAAGTARAGMPLPRSVRTLRVGGAEGVLVDLGGIVHFVTRRAPERSVLERLEPVVGALRAGVEAYGVVFLHEGRMIPLVKVPAAGSVVWEGSCGSGSLAAAAAESLGMRGGVFARDYVQPAGVIRAELTYRDGEPAAAFIGGSVTLDEPSAVEV